jgi:hypothetical protein
VLAAPQLRSFTWDFEAIDEQCGYCTSCMSFGPDQADWLRKLAATAQREKRALRSIEILFEPMDVEWVLDRLPRTPWELMDEVREDIALTGIQLLHPKRPSPEEFRRRYH